MTELKISSAGGRMIGRGGVHPAGVQSEVLPLYPARRQMRHGCLITLLYALDLLHDAIRAAGTRCGQERDPARMCYSPIVVEYDNDS